MHGYELTPLHKHTEYTLVNIKKTNFFLGQRLSCIPNSNWSFTDTNPEIKKNHNPSGVIISKLD